MITAIQPVDHYLSDNSNKRPLKRSLKKAEERYRQLTSLGSFSEELRDLEELL